MTWNCRDLKISEADKVSYHSVCFSWPCLAICKYTNIITIENRTNQRLRIRENFPCKKTINISDDEKTYLSATVLVRIYKLRPTLCWRRTKHFIEVKYLFSLFTKFGIGRYHEWHTSFLHAADNTILTHLPSQERSNSTVHPNISYQHAKILSIHTRLEHGQPRSITIHRLLSLRH